MSLKSKHHVFCTSYAACACKEGSGQGMAERGAMMQLHHPFNSVVYLLDIGPPGLN